MSAPICRRHHGPRRGACPPLERRPPSSRGGAARRSPSIGEMLVPLKHAELGADEVLVDLSEVAEQRSLRLDYPGIDVRPAELLRRLVPVPPGDEAIGARVPYRRDDDGLEQVDLPHRVGEFVDLFGDQRAAPLPDSDELDLHCEISRIWRETARRRLY